MASIGRMRRDKGARGELEVRDLFRKHGFTAERGRQRSGSPDSPDVKTCLDKWLHIEVKRCEQLSLYKAMAQAVKDAGTKMPVVFHRRNDEDWIVVLRAKDFFWLKAYVVLADAYKKVPRGKGGDVLE